MHTSVKIFFENINRSLNDFSKGLPILIAFCLFVIVAKLHNKSYVVALLLIPAALMFSAMIRMLVDYTREHIDKFRR